MKWFYSVIVFMVWASTHAQTITKEKNVPEYRLIIERESAYDFDTEKLQKSEWLIDPELSWKLSEKVKLFGQLRFYSEMTDRIEPNATDFSNYSDFSRPIEIGDRSQLELREFYADIMVGKSYWRVGKQQVVWGETDGFKILDQLNPMTFREFILDDFDDSRIPLWAIKGDFKIGKLKVQPYWSPDITSHQIPSNGGLYEPQLNMANPPAGINVDVLQQQRPGNFFGDSDLGIQVSSMWKGWDLSFNYIYQYDKTPVIKKEFDQSISVMSVQPTLKRQHVVGGSFGRTQGLFGLRSEIALFPNRHFMTSDVTDSDGIHRSSQLQTGMAIDYFGISNAILTLQWFGDLVSEGRNEQMLQRDQLIHTATIMHTQYFMNQLIELEVFGGYRFSEKGFLLDIKSSYLLRDNLKVWVGGDLFIANDQGLINPYNNRDRVFVGMEWGLQ